MISIRKYIEAYRESATTPAVPAQETRETAIPEYRALLVAIGRSADLALPSLQFRLDRMGLANSTLFTDVTENRLPVLTEFDVHRLVDGELSR